MTSLRPRCHPTPRTFLLLSQSQHLSLLQITGKVELVKNNPCKIFLLSLWLSSVLSIEYLNKYLYKFFLIYISCNQEKKNICFLLLGIAVYTRFILIIQFKLPFQFNFWSTNFLHTNIIYSMCQCFLNLFLTLCEVASKNSSNSKYPLRSLKPILQLINISLSILISNLTCRKW